MEIGIVWYVSIWISFNVCNTYHTTNCMACFQNRTKFQNFSKTFHWKRWADFITLTNWNKRFVIIMSLFFNTTVKEPHWNTLQSEQCFFKLTNWFSMVTKHIFPIEIHCSPKSYKGAIKVWKRFRFFGPTAFAFSQWLSKIYFCVCRWLHIKIKRFQKQNNIYTRFGYVVPICLLEKANQI